MPPSVPPPSISDRRSTPRHIPVLQLAAVQTAERSQLGLVLNVSRRGMKMRRLPGLEAGAQVAVRLRQHDLDGQVVWLQGDKVGIRFESPLTDAELETLLNPVSVGVRAPRLCTSRAVILRSGAVVTRGVLHNVSPSGAMIEARLPPNPEPMLMLTLPQIGQVLGQIRWTNGERLGLLFSKALSLADLAKLTSSLSDENNTRTISDSTFADLAD